MIRIAQLYARYDSTIEETELSAAAERLLEFAEQTTRNYFGVRYTEYGLTISTRLEVGSTKSWISIAALTAFLSQYGSVREGAVSIINDAANLTNLLLPGVSRMLGSVDQSTAYQRRTFGVARKLLRLFEQVERGEISANK